MKIGDTIITKGGTEYSIAEFITIKDESAACLTPTNGGGENFVMMEAYLNYFVGIGTYAIRRSNGVKKLKRRRCRSRGKRS
jgi:hypothetical protein